MFWQIFQIIVNTMEDLPNIKIDFGRKQNIYCMRACKQYTCGCKTIQSRK